MGLEWTGGYQKDIPPAGGPLDWGKETIPGLGEFLAEHRRPADRVVVSLPVHLMSLRALTLPFSDARKLEKVVPFEIEALLPYPLEEVVVDYHAVDTTDGKTHLLAAAAPRSLVKHYLDQLARAGIDPEWVELDGMALIHLMRHTFPERSAPGARAGEDPVSAVLDIGASKTIIGILRRGRAAFLRTILWGGRDMTTALAEACGISIEEAEEWKRQAGLDDSGISRLHQKGVSETIRRALEPLTAELIRTFHVAQAGEPSAGQKTVTELVLYGGGGKLKGLGSYLATELGLQVTGRAPKIVSGNGASWDPAFAVGLGLALRGANPVAESGMNFRKGEFAHGRERVGSRARNRFLWIAALLVAMLAGADLYLKYSLQMSQYQALKTRVREQFRTMFPEVKTIVDEVQQAKTAVAEMKKKSALFGTGDLTPLEVVAELSRRVPSSIKIEVQDLMIESGRFRLEAETDSFESVDKIKASLGQFEAFKDVTVSDAKVSADQSRVRFRLTVTLSPRESGRPPA